MLKGIPSCLSPDMVHAFMSMGHGDEIVIADADFPAATHCQRLIRADGLDVSTLLEAILPLYPLDTFVDSPVATMDCSPWGDEPESYARFRKIIGKHHSQFKDFELVERFELYERAKQAYAVIVTSEADGNVILKKGPVMGQAVMSKSNKKILFIGDSISEGHAASDPSKRYTTLVTNELSEAGSDYQEINIAVSGSTLVEHPWPKHGVSGMPFKLTEAISQKPDIIVIQHGVNDNGVGSSAFEFLWNYRKMVQALKNEFPEIKIVCMTICPSWLTDGSCWMLSMPWVNQVNVGIQELAARENTLVAQTNFMLQNCRELFADGVHPNDEGHRIMADSVLNALREDKKQSVDDFDVVINGSGQFRICGYVFEISPSESSDLSGFIEFYNLTKKGFTYKSDHDVKMISPVKQYPHKVILQEVAPGNDNIDLLWEEYSGRLTLQLKPSKEKMNIRLDAQLTQSLA